MASFSSDPKPTAVIEPRPKRAVAATGISSNQAIGSPPVIVQEARNSVSVVRPGRRSLTKDDVDGEVTERRSRI